MSHGAAVIIGNAIIWSAGLVAVAISSSPIIPIMSSIGGSVVITLPYFLRDKKEKGDERKP